MIRQESALNRSISLVLVLSFLAYFGCGNGEGPEVPFKTDRVTRGDIEHRVIATGRIEPFSRVEIRSKVNGIIKTITVDEGDRVKKGQIIIELDKDILNSIVSETRAALEKAKARYEQATIEASTVELDAAQKKFERTRKLVDQGLATEEQMEDAETALSMAKQMLQAKQVAVAIARSELSAVEAALERAEDELDFATIVSPMDGIVLSRDVDVGSAVASVVSTLGTLLMTLGDMRELHMVGDVDETDIGLVRVGMPARISVESFPDKKFHGHVRTISPLGVEKERIMNFEVEVTIEENDIPLRTNMTADAEIIIEPKKDVLLIPQNAIRYRQKQAYVEVPDKSDPSGKRPVDVTLGISGTQFSELISGLKEGDEVIVPGD